MRRIFFCFGLITATLLVVAPNSASASTSFLDEPFGATWAAGSDWIIASGSTYTPQIVTDNSATPASALRLAPATVNQNSAIFFADPQPTSQGLDVSFRQSQWGGTGADGITFFLQKGTESSTAAGSLGGALGYSAEFGISRAGLPSGLLGIGLDQFGNFVVPAFGGTGCTENNPGRQQNNLSIRGPGNGLVGYCRLAYVTNSDTNWAQGATSRAGGARSVRITIDPSTNANPKVKIWVCAATSRCDISTTPTLSTDSPAALIAEPTVRFGFGAGTGGSTNNHEIWDLQVASINVFPAVALSTTSLPSGEKGAAYSQSLVATGVAPITFAVATGSLPDGLSLDVNTGAITGTPTKSGTFTFSIRATDNRATGQTGKTVDRSYSISVSDPASTDPSNTEPSAPSNKVIRTLPVKDIVTNENVVAGSRVSIEAEGFTPSETVVVGIAGSTNAPKSVVANSKGAITARISLPTSIRGEVTLYAYGQTSKRGVKQTIAVELPATGVDSSTTTNIAIALLGVGIIVSIAANRRRRSVI